MPLVFVYGSLKQGFANAHVNAGRRRDGAYRTRERHPLVLLGVGEVPCIVISGSEGFQVVGELYDVADADMAPMDKLERVGEPDGYECVELIIERYDAAPIERLPALVYVKREESIPPSTSRIGPLAEYRHEHAVRFRWTGAA